MHCGSKINFSLVKGKTREISFKIKRHRNELINILLDYESYEVASDEINRTIDLLENISENKEYFMRRICSVFSFVPRNQPLYSFFCFVVIPSFLADKIIVKRPASIGIIFDNLLKTLRPLTKLSNLKVFNGKREAFLHLIQKTQHFCRPHCFGNAIIFTGNSRNANIVKNHIGRGKLFIGNGSSHNPIIVTETASLKKAVKGVLRSKLYNSGQDCASPNSILVHSNIYEAFMLCIKSELNNIRVGNYSNKRNRVGPLSDKAEIYRINNILACNKIWIDNDFYGKLSIENCILEPTIIKKPLKSGGNYIELFAPIFFIQKYNDDLDLSIYFENVNYVDNAGYISIFGRSEYIEKKIIGKKFMGTRKIIHPAHTIIMDNDLHEPGIERGIKPYGGYGKGSSFIAYNKKIISMPTLPQRDIFEILVKSKL